MTDLSKILCHENFDNRSGKLESVPDFGSCDNGTIKSDPRGSGKVGDTWIAKGQEGWGDWGYSWKNSTLQNCKSGDHIWWRLEIEMPDDFVVDSGPGYLKMFRIGRKKLSNDDNRGYVDWYIRNGHDNYQWAGIVEYEPDPPGQDTGWVYYSGGRVKKGKRQMFEFYTYLHPTAGIMRAWCDGEMFADTVRATIGAGSNASYVDRILFMTYYNEPGSPKTQGLIFDNHSVAVKNSRRDDRPHLSTDANGNLFIGTDLGSGPIGPPVDPIDPPVDPIAPGGRPIDENMQPVRNLVVSDITETEMTLTWNHAGVGVEGFGVERMIDGEWKMRGILDKADTKFVSERLPPGTLVRHRVAAGDLYGSQSEWTEIEAMTLGEEVDPPIDPPVDPPVDPAVLVNMEVREDIVYVVTDLEVVVLPTTLSLWSSGGEG